MTACLTTAPAAGRNLRVLNRLMVVMQPKSGKSFKSLHLMGLFLQLNIRQRWVRLCDSHASPGA